MFLRKKEKIFREYLIEKSKTFTREEIIDLVKEEYFTYRKKYKIGYFIFLALNIIIFIISASLVVLNLFAIRLNQSDISRPFFIAIAFITGSISFLTSINSFFEFKSLQKDLQDKIAIIDKELKKSRIKFYENNNDNDNFRDIIEIVKETIK